MTCIAGVVGSDGRVYVGGDSAGVAGWSITTRADSKVFRRGPYVFGFTTSFRMGQLIRYALDLPDPPDRNLDRFMVTTFVDSLRECFKAGGYAEIRNDVERGGTFLVGVNGRLFRIEGDYQVGESVNGWDACGCGQDEARGALWVLQRMKSIPPRRKVLMALEATAYQNGGGGSPVQDR